MDVLSDSASDGKMARYYQRAAKGLLAFGQALGCVSGQVVAGVPRWDSGRVCWLAAQYVMVAYCLPLSVRCYSFAQRFWSPEATNSRKVQ